MVVKKKRLTNHRVVLAEIITVASEQNRNSCSLFIEPQEEDDCRFVGEKEGGYRMLMERKEKGWVNSRTGGEEEIDDQ